MAVLFNQTIEMKEYVEWHQMAMGYGFTDKGYPSRSRDKAYVWHRYLKPIASKRERYLTAKLIMSGKHDKIHPKFKREEDI